MNPVETILPGNGRCSGASAGAIRLPGQLERGTWCESDAFDVAGDLSAGLRVVVDQVHVDHGARVGDVADGVFGKHTDKRARHGVHRRFKRLDLCRNRRGFHSRSDGASTVDHMQTHIGEFAFDDKGKRTLGVQPRTFRDRLDGLVQVVGRSFFCSFVAAQWFT